VDRRSRVIGISAFRQPGIPRSRDIPCTLISRNTKCQNKRGRRSERDLSRRSRVIGISTFRQPGIPRSRDIPCTLISRNAKCRNKRGRRSERDLSRRSRVIGISGISATGDSKEQGYPLYPDFAKRETRRNRRWNLSLAGGHGSWSCAVGAHA
jgi:hypothetical protein